jgi:hypothetical protein
MDEAGRRGRGGLICMNENGEWSVSDVPSTTSAGSVSHKRTARANVRRLFDWTRRGT